MPQGGLSMFGAGLQLQQVTPGVSNTGSAHLSGTFIADTEMYSLNPNKALSKFGLNPGTNYSTTNFGGGAGNGADNLLIGSGNVWRDGNVIQKCAIVGDANAVGNAAHVGMSSCLVYGSNNTVCTAGTNDNVLAVTVVGCSNQTNRNGGFGNRGPVIVGYGNVWNGWSMPGDYVPGVLIDHQRVLTGMDNVTVIGPLRTDAERAQNNTVVIGNTLQRTVYIGAFSLQATSQNRFKSNATVTVANSVATTSIIPAGSGSVAFAANTLGGGMVMKIKCGGYYVALAGSTNIRLQIQLQNSLFDSGVIALPATATNKKWDLELDVILTGAGVLTCIPNGRLTVEGAANALLIFSDAALGGMPGLDSTAPWTLSTQVTWSVASPSNSWTTMEYLMDTVG